MEDKNGKRESNIYSELFQFFSIKSKTFSEDSYYNLKQYGLRVCGPQKMLTIYLVKSVC